MNFYAASNGSLIVPGPPRSSHDTGGHINCDGFNVYGSCAFSAYAGGLQGFERGYRV